MNFDHYYWHDSVIKNIIIDRSKPGLLDTICFEIEWSNGNKGLLIFEDIYKVKMELNMGIVADETILNAKMEDDNDPYLIEFYSKWKGLMGNVKINSYLIELNSTGGFIKILAKRFKVVND